jgi:hypothetical protein
MLHEFGGIQSKLLVSVASSFVAFERRMSVSDLVPFSYVIETCLCLLHQLPSWFMHFHVRCMGCVQDHPGYMRWRTRPPSNGGYSAHNAWIFSLKTSQRKGMLRPFSMKLTSLAWSCTDQSLWFASRSSFMRARVVCAELLLNVVIICQSVRPHPWGLMMQSRWVDPLTKCFLSFVTSRGITLYGKGHLREARIAFNVAFMFPNQNSETKHFLLLIKVTSICLAYSLFHSTFRDNHEEAMLFIKELAAACPNIDSIGRRVVEVNDMQLNLVIDAYPCNLHIRHIYMFRSE